MAGNETTLNIGPHDGRFERDRRRVRSRRPKDINTAGATHPPTSPRADRSDIADGSNLPPPTSSHPPCRDRRRRPCSGNCSLCRIPRIARLAAPEYNCFGATELRMRSLAPTCWPDHLRNGSSTQPRRRRRLRPHPQHGRLTGSKAFSLPPRPPPSRLEPAAAIRLATPRRNNGWRPFS